MFGFLKPKREDQAVIKFLNKANTAWVDACYTGRSPNIYEYFDKPLVSKLSSNLQRTRDAKDGRSSFKHHSWVFSKHEGNTWEFIKNVTYDNVRMAYKVEVPAGEPYSEVWTLQEQNGTFKVIMLRSVYYDRDVKF